jgi:hypothetical protein
MAGGAGAQAGVRHKATGTCKRRAAPTERQETRTVASISLLRVTARATRCFSFTGTCTTRRSYCELQGAGVARSRTTEFRGSFFGDVTFSQDLERSRENPFREWAPLRYAPYGAFYPEPLGGWDSAHDGCIRGRVSVRRLGCYGETVAASHPSGAQRAPGLILRVTIHAAARWLPELSRKGRGQCLW